jgi:AraC family transcriptional regulator
MEQQKAIQRTIDYIEDHLQSPLDNAALARIAGYSEYHFLRVFKAIVHLTPADYIRKRRISEIVRRISSESGAISELAFVYGFNSKENFVRAFKREHHILPTDFRAAQNSLKLYDRLEVNKQEMNIQPKLCMLNAFRVIAYPSDETFPPHFWNKYNANGWSKRLTGGMIVEDYGISCWNAEKNRLDYAIGVKEEHACGDRSNTVVLDIPQGMYAVFETPSATAHDFVATIRRTWDWIYSDWLPQSGYRRAPGFELESYVESSRKYSERIYVPLIKN